MAVKPGTIIRTYQKGSQTIGVVAGEYIGQERLVILQSPNESDVGRQTGGYLGPRETTQTELNAKQRQLERDVASSGLTPTQYIDKQRTEEKAKSVISTQTTTSVSQPTSLSSGTRVETPTQYAQRKAATQPTKTTVSQPIIQQPTTPRPSTSQVVNQPSTQATTPTALSKLRSSISKSAGRSMLPSVSAAPTEQDTTTTTTKKKSLFGFLTKADVSGKEIKQDVVFGKAKETFGLIKEKLSPKSEKTKALESNLGIGIDEDVKARQDLQKGISLGQKSYEARQLGSSLDKQSIASEKAFQETSDIVSRYNAGDETVTYEQASSAISSFESKYGKDSPYAKDINKYNTLISGIGKISKSYFKEEFLYSELEKSRQEDKSKSLVSRAKTKISGIDNFIIKTNKTEDINFGIKKDRTAPKDFEIIKPIVSKGVEFVKPYVSKGKEFLFQERPISSIEVSEPNFLGVKRKGTKEIKVPETLEQKYAKQYGWYTGTEKGIAEQSTGLLFNKLMPEERIKYISEKSRFLTEAPAQNKLGNLQLGKPASQDFISSYVGKPTLGGIALRGIIKPLADKPITNIPTIYLTAYLGGSLFSAGMASRSVLVKTGTKVSEQAIAYGLGAQWAGGFAIDYGFAKSDIEKETIIGENIAQGYLFAKGFSKGYKDEPLLGRLGKTKAKMSGMERAKLREDYLNKLSDKLTIEYVAKKQTPADTEELFGISKVIKTGLEKGEIKVGKERSSGGGITTSIIDEIKLDSKYITDFNKEYFGGKSPTLEQKEVISLSPKNKKEFGYDTLKKINDIFIPEEPKKIRTTQPLVKRSTSSLGVKVNRKDILQNKFLYDFSTKYVDYQLNLMPTEKRLKMSEQNVGLARDVLYSKLQVELKEKGKIDFSKVDKDFFRGFTTDFYFKNLSLINRASKKPKKVIDFKPKLSLKEKGKYYIEKGKEGLLDFIPEQKFGTFELKFKRPTIQRLTPFEKAKELHLKGKIKLQVKEKVAEGTAFGSYQWSKEIYTPKGKKLIDELYRDRYKMSNQEFNKKLEDIYRSSSNIKYKPLKKPIMEIATKSYFKNSLGNLSSKLIRRKYSDIQKTAAHELIHHYSPRAIYNFEIVVGRLTKYGELRYKQRPTEIIAHTLAKKNFKFTSLSTKETKLNIPYPIAEPKIVDTSLPKVRKTKPRKFKTTFNISKDVKVITNEGLIKSTKEFKVTRDVRGVDKKDLDLFQSLKTKKDIEIKPKIEPVGREITITKNVPKIRIPMKAFTGRIIRPTKKRFTKTRLSIRKSQQQVYGYRDYIKTKSSTEIEEVYQFPEDLNTNQGLQYPFKSQELINAELGIKGIKTNRGYRSITQVEQERVLGGLIRTPRQNYEDEDKNKIATGFEDKYNIKTFDGLKIKEEQKIKTKQRERIENKFIDEVKVKTKQDLRAKEKLKLRELVLEKLVTKTVTKTKPKKKVERSFVLNIPEFNLRGYRPRRESLYSQARQPLLYTPSITSIQFGLKGKKKKGKFSGLEFRPVSESFGSIGGFI